MTDYAAYAKTIKTLLNDDKVYLSYAQLSKMIEEELNKPESEMNTDLIESCLDDIEKLEERKRIGIRPRGILKRTLVAAAIVIFIFALCTTVLAVGFHINVFSELVEFYNDHLAVRFDKYDKSAEEYKLLGSDLAKELSEYGITPVLLPEAILTEEFQITEIRCQREEYVTTVTVEFRRNEQKGYITISQFKLKDLMGTNNIRNDYDDYQEIEAAGITVYVFSAAGESFSVYQDNLTQYAISWNADFKEAVALAKTIK
jgi:hypothetical protein